MISQLEQVYLRLQDYLLELEIRYIEPILSKPIPDKGDELDLRSYCVLSHAAFEEFAETVATYALEQIVTRFVSNQEICLGLCTILHFSSIKAESTDNVNIVYDYIMNALKDIKSTMSTEKRKNNHGTSMKYLKKMLVPLGVSIPNDTTLLGSLEQLAGQRGAFAHNFSSLRITNVPSPLDLTTYVTDVNVLMKKLYEQVEGAKFFKYK